ncbi:MAG: hypothetical protein R3F53_08275 [Gammaproteobacteria bacterium]
MPISAIIFGGRRHVWHRW